jgi:hypothetical protein
VFVREHIYADISFKRVMVTLMPRRTFLQFSGISLLAVAGCLGRVEDIPDLTVHNERNEEVLFGLTITRIADGATLFSGEHYLANYETVTVSNPIQQEGDFRFEVTVEGLFEDTYDVSFSTDESHGVELYIQDDGLEFRKVTGGWL